MILSIFYFSNQIIKLCTAIYVCTVIPFPFGFFFTLNIILMSDAGDMKKLLFYHSVWTLSQVGGYGYFLI